MAFSIVAAILLIPGKTDFLGNLYSFGAMLSFTTAHVSVIALRLKDPDRPRPYRLPWNVRVRGTAVPLTAVLGAAGTFAGWVSVVILHDEARTVGLAWMAIGVVGFVVYRRIQRLDLTTPARIPRPQRPVGFKELDYRSALVPIFGTDVDGRGMASAVGLVGEDAYVDAVYVIRVPTQLSLDAGLEREEAVAVNVLETAGLRAQRAGLKVHTRIIRTRNPGAALVEEAQRQQSEVVYLATAHAPPDEQALGPTASYLLAKRPCRVIIETGPARAGTRTRRGSSVPRSSATRRGLARGHLMYGFVRFR